MANVKFVSDLHLGDERIVVGFRRQFSTPREHDEYIIDRLVEDSHKNDVLFILGDCCTNEESVELLRPVRGKKILLKGNHDITDTMLLLSVFHEVHGLHRYKNFWLSHCPIHPDELFKKINIHGHVHTKTIQDHRYVNVCLENINYKPITLNAIRKYLKSLEDGVILNLNEHEEWSK